MYLPQPTFNYFIPEGINYIFSVLNHTSLVPSCCRIVFSWPRLARKIRLMSVPAPLSYPWWHWIHFQELCSNAENNNPYPYQDQVQFLFLTLTYCLRPISTLQGLHWEGTIQGSGNHVNISCFWLLKNHSHFFLDMAPSFPLWAPVLLYCHEMWFGWG